MEEKSMTFEEIDAHLERVDLKEFQFDADINRNSVAELQSLLQKICVIYRVVRPFPGDVGKRSYSAEMEGCTESFWECYGFHLYLN